MPPASTATVGAPSSTATRWAIESIPRARPLMIATPGAGHRSAELLAHLASIGCHPPRPHHRQRLLEVRPRAPPYEQDRWALGDLPQQRRVRLILPGQRANAVFSERLDLPVRRELPPRPLEAAHVLRPQASLPGRPRRRLPRLRDAAEVRDQAAEALRPQPRTAQGNPLSALYVGSNHCEWTLARPAPLGPLALPRHPQPPQPPPRHAQDPEPQPVHLYLVPHRR